MERNRWGVYAFFFVLVAMVNIVGALIGGHAGNSWYQALYKPSFTPSAMVMMVMWPLFYIGVAIVGARIYLSQGSERKPALNVWLLQLIVTGTYPFLFFKLQSPILGFLETLVLWLLLAVLLLKVRTLDKIATAVLGLYWLWVAFMLVIGFSIMVHPLV